MGKEPENHPSGMELYEANIPLPERQRTSDGIRAVSDHVFRKHDLTRLLRIGEDYDAPYDRQDAADNMNA